MTIMTSSKLKPASELNVVVAFATVYIVWGSTYFFIQMAMHGFPPLLLGAIRFLMSGLLMLCWGIAQKEKLFVWNNIKHAAISGILLLFVGTGAVIWVEQYLASGVVAIMVSSSPIWFVVLDKPNWKNNFSSKSTIAGLLIGFAGVILLFCDKIADAFSTTKNHNEIAGMFILIMGSMAWAGGSLYSKYKSGNGSAAVNSAWQMLAAGIAFIPGSLILGEPQHLQWQAIPTDAWLSILYLVFFGSIAGFSAYVWLLKVRPATQVSTHAYVNPVVAVILGVLFAGEVISLIQVIGLIVILASVLMINLVKYRKERVANRLDAAMAEE
jgi:drug/metabolite transporter (DMT)-like permease